MDTLYCSPSMPKLNKNLLCITELGWAGGGGATNLPFPLKLCKLRIVHITPRNTEFKTTLYKRTYYIQTLVFKVKTNDSLSPHEPYY